MQYNGGNYFIWSGWTDSGNQQQQQLYIAQMSSPTQLTGDRVLLHNPDPAWQQRDGFGINEGPEILVHDDRVFLIYCKSPFDVNQAYFNSIWNQPLLLRGLILIASG